MSYTMRPLWTKDIFTFCKIFKKLQINVREVEFDENASSIAVGIAFLQKGIENLYLAEEEVNAFLADLVGIAPEEFSTLPLADTIEIISLFKEQEGIATFLKLATQKTITS